MKKLIVFFMVVQWAVSQAVTLQDINTLKKENLLTEDQYQIMVTELKKTLKPNKKLYTLNINRNNYDKLFPVMEYKNDVYIDVNKFLELLNIKHSVKNNSLVYYLNYADSKGQCNSINLEDKENILIEKDIPYMKSSFFNKKFCNNLNIEKNIIDMNINFLTMKELNDRFNILEKRTKQKEIYTYKNKQSFLNLGVIEPVFYKSLTNSDWNGNLKYYSDFLYGDLKTNYNFKNKSFDEINLKYDYILKDHEINLYDKKDDWSDSSSENYGISIEKNDGYVSNGNTTFIKENVPRGSKVELFFLNKLIQVQSENDGKVYFYGPLIKRGYLYTLKIHTLDGGVYTKTINIVDDYNLQEKNDYDYNFQLEKNKDTQKIYENGSFYYGVTDHLTLGAKNKYLQGKHYLGENIILGNNFSSSSYVVNFENFENTSNRNDYLRKVEGKFNYKSFENKFNLEKNNSPLSDIKDLKELESRYYVTPDHNSYLGLISSKKNNVGYFSPTYNINLPVKDYFYNVSGTKNSIENTITTSYKNCFLSLRASYDRKEKDLKASFDIMSIYSRPFDYNFTISYSKKQKELFTFRFTLDYDNWLKFKTYFNDNTNKYDSSVRVDKYIDLKNLSGKNLNSIKVIPFLDKNKNGKKDKNEELFNNVMVDMNGDKHIVLNDKPAYFDNIGRNMAYTMNIAVRSYGYKAKYSQMNIVKNTNQIMDVYIPIEEVSSNS